MTLYCELGRAVSRGLLPIHQAEAALLAAIARDRGGHVSERFHIASHILRLHVDQFERERDQVLAVILRATRPLIDRLLAGRVRRGHVRAEAHDVNAGHGCPFTEDEVEGILVERVRRAVRQRDGVPAQFRPMRRRHG